VFQACHVTRCIMKCHRVLPGKRRLRGRRHVLGHFVEPLADRIVRAHVGPVRREDLVCLATEQQVERRANDLSSAWPETSSKWGIYPAPELETARRILLGRRRKLGAHADCDARYRHRNRRGQRLETLARAAHGGLAYELDEPQDVGERDRARPRLFA
jgi:hypothetical protein